MATMAFTKDGLLKVRLSFFRFQAQSYTCVHRELAIVDLVKSGGGVMTLEDLAECTADVIQPISYTFKPHHPPNHEEPSDPGLTLWECPPNGQGITALMALGIIEAVEEVHGIDVLEIEHNGKLYLHILIESLRLAFADSEWLPYSKLRDLLKKGSSILCHRSRRRACAHEGTFVQRVSSEACISH